MTPPPAKEHEVALSDGEMARLQDYAAHHGLSIDQALAKASQDALLNRILPSRRTAPASITAFTRRLHAVA